MSSRTSLSPSSEAGFTMIELLTIASIIAILAAISLPGFLSQRQKASDGDAKTLVRHAQTALASQFTESATVAVDAATLLADEPALRAGAGKTLAVTGDGREYSLAVTSKSGTTFTIRATRSGVEHSCDRPAQGGCPADAHW